MASTFVQFLCVVSLVLMESSAQPDTSSRIKLGSSLSTNNLSSWFSPSGIFAFGFYPQGPGFAIGIWLINPHSGSNTTVWTANRDDPPVSPNSKLDLSLDGKLLLKTDDFEKSLTGEIKSAGSAAMLDSGNFVLYDSNSSIIWESFDYPTDTLLGGQNLTSGKKLVSRDVPWKRGRFCLVMQNDGNLVAYPLNTSMGPDDSYWSSGTYGISNSPHLSLDQEGSLNLNINDSYAKSLASFPLGAKKETIIYLAILNMTGNLRLYYHLIGSPSTITVYWEALLDACEVKGLCGLNSYCSIMDGYTSCSCLPGFKLVDPSNRFSGCFKNFMEDECGRKELITMENVLWGDFPYFNGRMSRQDCNDSCREDCNCGAAIYQNNMCNKYKLPLRYARSNINISSTVFLSNISTNSEVLSPNPPSFISNPVSILAICFASASCLSFIFSVSTIFVYIRRVYRYKKLSENAKLRLEEEFTMQSFTYEELKKITNGFRELIGRGSFGQTYKGTMSINNRLVAVKKLEKIIGDGEGEFRAQMATIGRTNHRNLVRLLGFCIESHKVLLVYEFMSNGSLADLFKARTRLSWRDRLRASLDMARGIRYLHEECQVPIAHYNIKPQNILLDDSMTAKVADFGLAKLLMPNQARTSKYLAPEWQNNALMSHQSDIYSFGILLLEIACCRSNIEVNVATADEIALTVWAYNCYMGGKLDQLVDEQNVDLNILGRMVKVALLCIQDEPALRPPMKNVILMLEGMMDVPNPPPSTSLAIS